MRSRTFIAALAVGILSAGGMASATTDLAAGNLSGNTSIGVHPGTSDMSVTFGSTTYNPAFVGLINWTTTTPVNTAGTETSPFFTTGGPFASSFSTYCIEGTQDVFFGGTYQWTVTQLSDDLAPDPGTHFTSTQIAELNDFWNRFYDKSLVAGTNSANVNATAFQLGIWEIAGGDALSTSGTATNYFTTGHFTGSGESAALTEAATWLDAVATGGAYATQGEYTVLALTNPSAQDQLVGFANPTFGSPPTPIPAALPAGLSLMGCIGAVQFLRRRRQTVAV